jgi:hypothetical protein
LAVSYTWSDWIRDNWQLVLFPLLAVLLIAVAVYYWVKRKKDIPVTAVVVPALPAHTIALNQLTALKDKKLWQQDQVKEYYSELTGVLREYLEKRYAIRTHEKTTEEIITGLQRAEITADHKAALHQLLTLADMVKFAKEKPVAVENERSIEDAILFVSSTRKTVTDQPGGSAGAEGKAAEHSLPPGESVKGKTGGKGV